MKFLVKGIKTPVEIREINRATYFLPKINPAANGKPILDIFANPNPVEEHCHLVLKSSWEDVSDRMVAFDECVHFRTALKELVNHLKKTGDAKKGEGGQISRQGEGPSRQGEGPRSTRGKGSSYKRGEGSSIYKRRRWF
ncbi:hypothetical protein F511_21806 [Dorcoceras hygrometricum]|uniref:Uncharacterized protein n=1 Tax=Dorcoceras hygrometricum TaxID=472368 RepID=A0A2Z7DGX8_9LAMI|nr:hypothetical protein F511_21806 [Dorcoceras hygrometricum]